MYLIYLFYQELLSSRVEMLLIKLGHSRSLKLKKKIVLDLLRAQAVGDLEGYSRVNIKCEKKIQQMLISLRIRRKNKLYGRFSVSCVFTHNCKLKSLRPPFHYY